MNFTEFKVSQWAKGLNDGQLSFFKEFLETKNNLFLTGTAGTGKSYVLNRLSEFCDSEGIILNKTASTGVSALNIGGLTVHSFMGLGLAEGSAEILIAQIRKNKNAKRRLRDCKLLLIDEISMISGELLDKIHAVLRAFSYYMPRVIVVGDFLQLSPVFKQGNRQFAFESSAWSKFKFKSVFFSEVVRQDKESEYAKFLGGIRVGEKNRLDFLEGRLLTKGSKAPEGTITVFSKNVDVDDFNNERLQKIPGELKVFYAEDHGDPNIIRSFDRNCNAPFQLNLKVGAQVVLLKNQEGGELVNGSIGKVTGFLGKGVYVQFDCGTVLIEQYTWKVEEKYLEGDKVKVKVLASRTQIPLKLGWASTIHRCQGLTCDKIAVDVSDCFADGQFFTALSRARSVEGLYVIGYEPHALRTNQRCLDFYGSAV
jgi:ATP-dependent exoDNAse (exonuclease V) alpha subunit